MDAKQVLLFGLHLFNFAVFLWLIVRFASRKVKDFLLKRKEAIRREMEEAEKIFRSAEERLNELNLKLNEIEREKGILFGEFKALGERERDKIIKESMNVVEKIKQELEFHMQQDFKKLKQDLEKELIEKTIERVRNELSGERGAKIHGDYLKFFINREWWKYN